MKVYFTASARGKSDLDKNYQVIYDAIEDLGHRNIDDLIVKIDQDRFYDDDHAKQVQLYKKTIKNIDDADLIVLEVSVHSLSMGFVLTKALESGKPVVALYTKDHEPHFALGIDNDKLQVIEYKIEMVKKSLQEAVEFAESQADTRFNFFISPKIGTFLDWISMKKRVPRAVYLRRLIEEDMKRQKEYLA